MKRRTLTTLVALAIVGGYLPRTDAATILVTEQTGSGTGDFKQLTGTTSGVVNATVSTNLSSPFGITTDSAGNVYVVNNGGGANINSIAKFTSSLVANGFFVAPNAGGLLNSPVDMAIKPSTGNAYFTNTGPLGSGGSITQQNLNGTLPGTFTSNGAPNNGNLTNPFGERFNSAELLYVVNRGDTVLGTGGYVNVYNTALSRAPQFSFGGAVGPGLLHNPEDVAFDAAGNVYVSDIFSGGSTIQRYTAAGVSLGTFISSNLNGPVGLVFDPTNGDLFVANSGDGTIGRYNSAGVFQGSWASNLSTPLFLTLSPNTAIPEPGSLVILGLGQGGLLAFGLLRYRRKVDRAA